MATIEARKNAAEAVEAAALKVFLHCHIIAGRNWYLWPVTAGKNVG